MPYATREALKLIACAGAEALGMESEAYDILLDLLIKGARVAINSELGRSYTDAELAANEDLADTLESISIQAADNYLLSVLQRKQSPIVTINDFAVKSPPRVLLTNEMKETLERYKETGKPLYNNGVARFSNDKTHLIAEES
ncbi:MAG: hypothetical protein A4E56_00139 [Pelotomaculum sp. PtaU1.Bin065]|nr:MAG: hypothetical protein A4E56_00139 [Pelotomaculum sp. PtaU1.Bin065]